MLTLFDSGGPCNYHVDAVDYRLGVEGHACCESLDDVAFWLAANDFSWLPIGFVREATGPHGKRLFARVYRGRTELTRDQLRDSVLPLFAQEAAV